MYQFHQSPSQPLLSWKDGKDEILPMLTFPPCHFFERKGLFVKLEGSKDIKAGKMLPVTPNPRRSSFRRYGKLKQQISFGFGDAALSPGGSSSFLAPPLYREKEVKHGAQMRSTKVLLVTDKDGRCLSLPRSPSTFRPVLSPKDERMKYGIKPYTPPVSPYHPQQHKWVPSSPSPSMMSVTSATETTENLTVSSESMTSYCMSPSPVCVPCNSNETGGKYSPSTPTGYPSARRRSSTKKKSKSTSVGDDGGRKQREKLELCSFYVQGQECPYAGRCIFAHGEDELKIKTLMGMYRAGYVEDVETYRTKPCLTWVCTGSW